MAIEKRHSPDVILPAARPTLTRTTRKLVAIGASTGGTEALRELGFLKQIFGAEFDPAQYRMLLFGFAMVLIIAWKPRGLIGLREPTLVLKERKKIDTALAGEVRA